MGLSGAELNGAELNEDGLSASELRGAKAKHIVKKGYQVGRKNQ